MNILGIETSCDETAAALVRVARGRFRVVRNVVSSHIDIHRAFGGVVPEVAARTHVARIIPVIKRSLRGYAQHPEPSTQHLDLIAVTVGPGLMTSLSVGLETARHLASAWDVPLVATNHLAGHLYASLLGDETSTQSPASSTLAFPALGLIISGGHTELVLMKEHGRFTLIGETRDDAAGEAFDKIAKMLGLPYPGGPALARLAKKGNPHAYDFPRAMIHDPHFEFSFSGLKTSVRYFLEKHTAPQIKKMMPDIAASVEEAIVDVVVTKTIRAAKKHRVNTVLIGGGVSANRVLRRRLGDAIRAQRPTTNYKLPTISYSTDNAAMIAVAGYYEWKRRGASALDRLDVDPHLPLPR